MLSLGFCLSVFYLVILVHVSSSFFNFICLSFFPLLGGTGPDLKFVATVATGGRVNFFQLYKFFQKTTKTFSIMRGGQSGTLTFF